MRLFSNRKRPVALGAFPLERLARADLPAESLLRPDSPSSGDGLNAPDASLAHSIAPYLALYRDLRDGETAAELGQTDFDPRRMADNLKASCYFLDAAMVGVCALPEGAWVHTPGANAGKGGNVGNGGAPHPAHTHAVVILVEDGPEAVPGSLEAHWLTGAQRARGVLRGGEIACTLAGYIRHLGFGARAHFGTASEVPVDSLVALAGLGRWNAAGDAVVNPFLGTGFTAAVVTTALQLTPDRPLAPVRSDRGLRHRSLGALLGTGGVRPGWKRLWGGHRPAHLGRFPMERLRRRDTPTTYISDAVPRVPIRGSMFNRAIHGDLGEKARVERGRFALKNPFAAAMAPLFMAMVPHQDGQTAPQPAAGTGDPRANAQALKAACHTLGADVVGICRVPDYAWYSHDEQGNAIMPDHSYAVVILIDQGFETMEGASGDDWISGAQSMRAYMRGAEITGVLAHHVRSLGHSARSHTNRLSDVLHVPLILQAGLGELSRIGELVLNPFVGPRFKSAVLTTNMPLEVDRPVDFGLQDFCGKCRKCARECPCGAIALGPKTLFNGYEIWKPDAEKCAKYRLTNQKGSACGRCMTTCPYNTEGLAGNRLWLWAAMHLPWARRWLAERDDRLGRGERNPVKRWWLDLELIDGCSVTPQGVNERDLRPDLKLDPAKQKIAHYPADMNPPPGQMDAFPVDRAEGLRRGQAAREAARG